MEDWSKVAIVFFAVGLPVVAMVLWGITDRWLSHREKRLALQAQLAAEKAAQYAATNAELDARVRVLEKIVTDGGIETAAQIEALRDAPRLRKGSKVQ